MLAFKSVQVAVEASPVKSVEIRTERMLPLSNAISKSKRKVSFSVASKLIAGVTKYTSASAWPLLKAEIRAYVLSLKEEENQSTEPPLTFWFVQPSLATRSSIDAPSKFWVKNGVGGSQRSPVKFTVSGPQIGGAKSGICFDGSDPRKKGVLERKFRC